MTIWKTNTIALFFNSRPPQMPSALWRQLACSSTRPNKQASLKQGLKKQHHRIASKMSSFARRCFLFAALTAAVLCIALWSQLSRHRPPLSVGWWLPINNLGCTCGPKWDKSGWRRRRVECQWWRVFTEYQCRWSWPSTARISCRGPGPWGGYKLCGYSPTKGVCTPSKTTKDVRASHWWSPKSWQIICHPGTLIERSNNKQWRNLYIAETRR